MIRPTTLHVGVERQPDGSWLTVDRHSGSQLGRPWPTMHAAVDYAEHREATTYDGSMDPAGRCRTGAMCDAARDASHTRQGARV